MPPSVSPLSRYWRASSMVPHPEEAAMVRGLPACVCARKVPLLERVWRLLDRAQVALVVGKQLVVARGQRVVSLRRLFEGGVVGGDDAFVFHFIERVAHPGPVERAGKLQGLGDDIDR